MNYPITKLLTVLQRYRPTSKKS